MATKIILSSSIYGDYAFPVGIAALLWHEIVEYDPFVFIVGSSEDWSHGKPLVSYDFIREHGVKTFRLEPLDNWPLHVTAQNCRYHAAELSYFRDDGWLMLSDADIFPLKREFYHQHEDYAGRFAFYYANGDHGNNYPTCHIAARAKDWRDVMELEANDDLLGQMRRNLDSWLTPRLAGLAPSVAGMKTWMVDMHSFMDRIKAKPWHPAECKMIEREGHPPKDRLDRSAWPASYEVSKYTDAHILKEPYTEKNWGRIRPMIEQLIPQHIARIDCYVEDFRRA